MWHQACGARSTGCCCPAPGERARQRARAPLVGEAHRPVHLVRADHDTVARRLDHTPRRSRNWCHTRRHDHDALGVSTGCTGRVPARSDPPHAVVRTAVSANRARSRLRAHLRRRGQRFTNPCSRPVARATRRCSTSAALHNADHLMDEAPVMVVSDRGGGGTHRRARRRGERGARRGRRCGSRRSAGGRGGASPRDGAKVLVVGRWLGSAETATVVTNPLADLRDRGSAARRASIVLQCATCGASATGRCGTTAARSCVSSLPARSSR